MDKEFVDYYAILDVGARVTAQSIRRAFRKRLLEVHPDKAEHPTHPEQLKHIIAAFEVLADPALRERYDRVYELRRSALGDRESSIPHVIDSERPADRARAVLYFLVKGQASEAVRRLGEFEGMESLHLSTYLDEEEFIDASFLLAEYFEGEKEFVRALEWYGEVINREMKRRKHRPCYPEVMERTRKVLIHRMTSHADPRVALEYLRRAEALGVTKADSVEVSKKRATCYLEMDMKVEAARHLHAALCLQPQLKGIARLREDLEGYL